MNDLPTLSPLLAELKKRLFALTEAVEQLTLRVERLERERKWWWEK